MCRGAVSSAPQIQACSVPSTVEDDTPQEPQLLQVNKKGLQLHSRTAGAMLVTSQESRSSVRLVADSGRANGPQQGFSTRDNCASQRALGNVWRHPLVATAWEGGVTSIWWVEARSAVNILQCTEQPL